MLWKGKAFHGQLFLKMLSLLWLQGTPVFLCHACCVCGEIARSFKMKKMAQREYSFFLSSQHGNFLSASGQKCCHNVSKRVLEQWQKCVLSCRTLRKGHLGCTEAYRWRCIGWRGLKRNFIPFSFFLTPVPSLWCWDLISEPQVLSHLLTLYARRKQ